MHGKIISIILGTVLLFSAIGGYVLVHAGTHPIPLSKAKSVFSGQYSKIIDDAAARFLEPGEDPSQWYVNISRQIEIQFTHASGRERTEKLEKEGKILMGNPSGRDGACTYDFDREQLINCGIWQ